MTNLLAPPDLPAPLLHPRHRAPDLENRIGGRGLLYIGVLVLLFGVSFFLKYAFDNAWVDETGRVGARRRLSGVGARRRLACAWPRAAAVFGQALTGTGLAILYLVVYAALNFYGLIDRPVAFVLMVANTVAAAWWPIVSGRRPSPSSRSAAVS